MEGIIQFVVIFFVLGAISIWVNKNLPKWTGKVGERRVQTEIEKLEKLKPNQYKAFHDLYIPKQAGGYSQIDHIVVSEYGIFVLETKNYDGWIFGEENKKYWTQVIYKRKEKFLNPIWQNKDHIKSLKEWLGPEFESAPYFSMVVFFKSASFKTEMNFKEAEVIYVRNLIKTIEQYQTTAISKETAERISDKLNRLMIGNKNKKKEIVKQHVQNINNAKGKQKANVDNSKCPKCGGNLKVKNGKYGKFVGCSNYPKCRYTRKEVINPGSKKIQQSSST